MEQISISGLTIDVVRKDIKNIHLGVYPPDGKIRIAAPLRINDEALRLFAISKLTWIKNQQKSFARQERQSEREYISGESHYFNGKRYLLNVITHDGRNKVHLRHRHIDLFMRPDASQEQRTRLLNEWYRKHLKELVPPMMVKWERILGVKANFTGIRQMKTRWGSCNIEKKRIWLNLELAKKPSYCVEYVIVHELVHLLERYHNETFSAYMNRYMPNWEAAKEELNTYPL